MKVSIIVPVYRAEKYIRRCLDSIVAQTMIDWECILVDDGSPDRSGEICDEYDARDPSFKVIHKENDGVAAARQCGLDNAGGEYIIHCDPDDWVEKDWLQELYQTSQKTNADIVSCDFYKEYADKTIYKSERPSSYDNKEIIKDMLSERIWGSTCNKLVRKFCFEKYSIAFIPEMNLWEDLMVCTKLLYHNATLTHKDKALYHYDCHTNNNSLVRKGSLSHIRSEHIYIDYVDSILGEDASFEDDIFHCKTMIKRRIFYLGRKYNSMLKDTCDDINDKFIKEYGKWNGNMLYFTIALCLKGYPMAGHLFYNFMTYFYSPLIHSYKVICRLLRNARKLDLDY